MIAAMGILPASALFYVLVFGCGWSWVAAWICAAGCYALLLLLWCFLTGRRVR